MISSFLHITLRLSEVVPISSRRILLKRLSLRWVTAIVVLLPPTATLLHICCCQLFGESDLKDLIVVSGPVFSQMTAVWEVESEVTHHQGQQPPPAVFLHTVRLYHMPGHLSEAVHVENLFDFGSSQRMKDKELFMRLRSGVRNGEPASFYSDQSGLGMQKRVWVDSVGLEGNYYPVTTAAYMEDAGNRITVLVDHAAGAAAVKEGWLEVMVDRRWNE